MREIEQADKAVAEHIKFMQKLHAILTRAQKKTESGKQMVLALDSLAEDLRSFPTAPALPSLRELADVVAAEARKHAEQGERVFDHELRNLAEAARIPILRHGDDVAIGPFQLVVNARKGLVALRFAKVEVESGLPLAAREVLDRVLKLSKELLATPGIDDLDKLVKALEEAVRVSVARRGGSLVGELRADLPSVYREMRFIRGSGEQLDAYPLARFIVELKTLIQSDLNTSRARRFRLETAVIENTKNPKKSVFIPTDLSRSYGEGTYFQAVILSTGN